MSGSADEFLLEEYRQLWAYYQRTLDERKNLFEWYSRAVALPAAVITYLASEAPGSPSLPESVVASLLAVVGMIGLALYGTYAKESANAGAYLEALRLIRSHYRKANPELSSVLIVDKLRESTGGSVRFGKVTAWRVAAVAIANSALLAAAAAVLALPEHWVIAASLSFVIGILGHVVLFNYLYHGLSPSPTLQRLRTLRDGAAKVTPTGAT